MSIHLWGVTRREENTARRRALERDLHAFGTPGGNPGMQTARDRAAASRLPPAGLGTCHGGVAGAAAPRASSAGTSSGCTSQRQRGRQAVGWRICSWQPTRRAERQPPGGCPRLCTRAPGTGGGRSSGGPCGPDPPTHPRTLPPSFSFLSAARPLVRVGEELMLSHGECLTLTSLFTKHTDSRD